MNKTERDKHLISFVRSLLDNANKNRHKIIREMNECENDRLATELINQMHFWAGYQNAIAFVYENMISLGAATECSNHEACRGDE